jgi:transcriptional regulator with PAS, ATPase and Fis domain
MNVLPRIALDGSQSPAANTSTWKFQAKTAARSHVLHLAQRVAASSCPVMILGPTGVGKEVLANDIHHHSAQANGPFISVNCAAFPPALFDSAFFGHVRGSFTGAMADKPGFVELAHGGTLFLDELGDLPLDAQAKLLRFIATGTYWPVGAVTERRSSVRILSATHRALDAGSGDTFREDLFFRLSVLLLRIPPLEPKDIAEISKTLIMDALLRHRKMLSVAEIDDVSQCCMDRPWRGGVREMQNAIERFVVLLHREEPVADQLESALGMSRRSVDSGVRARRCDADLAKTLEDLLFLGLARECRDVRQLAEISDRTLQAAYSRLKKLDIDPADLGPTMAVQSALERHREKLVPHQRWILSLLLGK